MDRGELSARQRWSTPLRGFLVGFGGVLVVALALEPLRGHLARATPVPILLVPVISAGYLGGRRAAMLVAVLSSVVYWLEFIPPAGSLRVPLFADVVSLLLYLTISTAIGAFVARQTDARQRALDRADELARMHGALRHAVAERDRLELENRRVAVLEHADRQRASLLRAVSHDLRTPLATIRAAATELNHGGVEFDAAARSELLGLVAAEAERLDRIVANLLSLGRVEAGNLLPERQPVELNNVVDACVARITPLLQDRRVEVELPLSLPLIEVDVVQIDQVFTNLLENTARHAIGAHHVTISARAGTSMVEIDVIDDGPGVSARQLRSLFESFQHLPSGGTRSTDHRGVGMGLAVCRAIVEAHGGTLWLDERYPHGARFVFTLPVARRP